MRKRNILAGAICLIVLQIATLVLTICVCARRVKYVHLNLYTPRIAMVTSANQMPTMPAGYTTLPTFTFALHQKWTTVPTQLLIQFDIVVYVEPQGKLPPVHDMLQQVNTHPDAGVFYAQAKSDSLINQVKGKWKQFIAENVTPAWWTRLLFADTSVVVFTRRYPSRALLIPRFMQQFDVADDLVFGYIFSACTSHVSALLPPTNTNKCDK